MSLLVLHFCIASGKEEGLQFPEKLFIQSYDIDIILGNALDNAMEACRKLKTKEPDTETFIRISSFQKRELFFLKVENSFDGKMVRKPQNEFPVTDKAEQYRENAAGKSEGVSIAELAAAKAAEQAAKKKRREEYAQLNEESGMKRKLLEQEADEIF